MLINSSLLNLPFKIKQFIPNSNASKAVYSLRPYSLSSVGPLGIEPSLPTPKAGVLPVYYGPYCFN